MLIINILCAREIVLREDIMCSMQAENFDAEAEALQPGKKKGKPPARLVHAEESANRHRAHIQRLEQAKSDHVL